MEPRPDVPIYVAALSPRMLQNAGELADGVILWLCNPEYIREVVVPEVTKGREKAGKSLDGFDIVAAVPSALTDDLDAAVRVDAPRPPAVLRAAVLPRDARASGFGDDIAAFDEAAGAGDAEAMQAAISDRFLEALTATATRTTCAPGSSATAPRARPRPCVGPDPRTDFEATLRAAAP